MAILITGAGAIGCHTARALCDRGDSVVLLDVAPSLDAIRTIIDPARLTLVRHDIVDYEGLLDIIRTNKVDRILHTAAMLTRAMREKPRAGVLVNVVGSTNVLEAARVLGLGRIVLVSSGIVGYASFGSFRGQSFPEDFPMKAISERPNSLYGTTKLASEYIGLFYNTTYRTDVVVLRYGAVVGAWAGPSNNVSGRMLTSLLRPAIEGKTAVIDDPLIAWSGGEEFVDIRDVVQANLAALDAPAPASRVYNVGSGKMHSFQDVVDEVRKLFPEFKLEVKVRLAGGMVGFEHERPAASDISRAAAELGFTPRYSLGESIEHFAHSLQAA